MNWKSWNLFSPKTTITEVRLWPSSDQKPNSSFLNPEDGTMVAPGGALLSLRTSTNVRGRNPGRT